MKENTAKTVFRKLIILIVFYLLIQLICGWLVHPAIATGPQYLLWKKFFVVSCLISLSGLAIGYYLSEKLGYQKGGYARINCLAAFIVLACTFLFANLSKQPLLYDSHSIKGIDYIMTFLCAGECFLESILFGILLKVICRIIRKK